MTKAELSTAKKEFKKKVEKTKYCRINACKRCGEWKSFLIFISFIYNICLVVVSVLSISLFKDKYILNVVITILSVIVFASSLFVSSLDYSRKANEYRHCYEALEELLCKLKLSQTEQDFCSISEKYDTIIHFSLNHDEIDYCRLRNEYPDFFKEANTDDKEFEKQKIEYKKKYKKLVAKYVILKTVLTAIVFYPVYIVIKLIVSKVISK